MKRKDGVILTKIPTPSSGNTLNPTPNDLLDLSLPTLIDDFVECLSAQFPDPAQAPDLLVSSDPDPLFVIGDGS